MGTRNLTVVKANDEIKVAQYGQWDGYPEGQGLNIVNFIESHDLDEFKERVSQLEFFTDEEIEKINNAGNVFEKYPYLSRDLGGEILKAIADGKYRKRTNFMNDEYKTYEFEIDKLVNQFDFGRDSLFCEWAYVLDLDKKELTVYEGFQKEPHDEGIFADFEAKDSASGDTYYPVKPVKTFDLTENFIKKRFKKWIANINKEEEQEEVESEN